MHQHEAAAAEIAGLRMRDREREADCDRGIDRVAAAFQNLHAHAGGAFLLARHHAVAGDGGQEARRIGDDRRGRGRRRLCAHKRNGGQQAGRRNR
jgi:hypothetical protein